MYSTRKVTVIALNLLCEKSSNRRLRPPRARPCGTLAKPIVVFLAGLTHPGRYASRSRRRFFVSRHLNVLSHCRVRRLLTAFVLRLLLALLHGVRHPLDVLSRTFCQYPGNERPTHHGVRRSGVIGRLRGHWFTSWIGSGAHVASELEVNAILAHLVAAQHACPHP